MKKRIELIPAFLEHYGLDYDMFYSINITEYTIRLQGKLNAQIISINCNLEVATSLTKSGWIEFEMDFNNYRFNITLT